MPVRNCFHRQTTVSCATPSYFNTHPSLPQRLLLVLAILTLAVRPHVAAAAPATPAPAQSDRLVVMISLDGLAAYYLDDPKAEMPTLRALAAEGARATSMKASTPTVTWPNHTTLVTGDNPARHGVVGNNYFDRATGKRVVLITDPVYDKDEIVKVPTIYDVARAAGLKTAAIRWPATRNARTLDWTIPDVATMELMKKYTTPALGSQCEQAGISLTKKDGVALEDNNARELGDETWTRAFNLILQKDRPNLALLHLVNVDHTQHLKGPKSDEAYAAVKGVDAQVREVWEELQRDYPGKATLLVVSDHGFSPIKRTILPNVVLRKAGLLNSEKKRHDGAVQVVPQGGSAFIYITDDANRPSLLKRIEKAFAGMPEVAKIVGPKQLKDYGVANPKDDAHAPDMILFAQEGYAFGDTAAGDLPFEEKPERRGSHGHDSSLPDLHATFVAWGAGIKPGTKLGEISNTSVAPTIAQLLGLKFSNVDGKPLTKILTN
ncbi:alkaline phosphatase family protein [Pedosphaera parvula]|uniref:Type I phosphodiesterase/nucleotide pyrophosphatase n=1 Tax=Pedosphaera parvula (strain Ellin514) TaxID=320771 RepID=B9XGV6_PEDPL|nr:ectonucleotide pyrophosphatase/phosphodiesterase [Pedosphaera parvula]EEF60877.1 type I phosphodiesterase/nucleotide pyrophosphatase [Pedosphaera parvula Ellin514]